MKVGIDVALPFADQWFNKLPTDIFNLVIKHLRLVAENIDKAGQRLKKGLESSTVSNQRIIFSVFRDIDEPWCPEMVLLPAGKFLMGSPKSEEDRSEEEIQHEVTISQPFAIGRYAVTFDEYDHFCDQTGRDKPGDEGWGRGRRPVIDVRHDDAQAYCVWLSKMTKGAYQLPTEAMWEYACRAGTTTPFSFGETITTDQANFHVAIDPSADAVLGQYRGKTVLVKHFPANPWNLHEMHGNVWEWVLDWDGGYPSGSVTDPQGPSSGIHRILRGGSWKVHADYTRSAYRNQHQPPARNDDIGFRCVRVQVG